MDKILKGFLVKPSASIIVLRLIGIFLIAEFIFLLNTVQVQDSGDVVTLAALCALFIGFGLWLVFYTTCFPMIKFKKFAKTLSQRDYEDFFNELQYSKEMRMWHTEKYVINAMLAPVKVTEIFWIYVHKHTTSFIGIPIVKSSTIRVYTNDCKLVVFGEKKNSAKQFMEFILSHSSTPLIGYTDANNNAFRQRKLELKGKK